MRALIPVPPPTPGLAAAYGLAERVNRRQPGVAAPTVDAAALDALLPAPGRDFLFAFLVAALRPDARTWLGPDRLRRLAGLLKLKDQALGQLLDAPPRLPEALVETGSWTGRRVPMLKPGGEIGWIELLWRPDTHSHGTGPRPARPENGSFTIKLELPATGPMEIRGRLEGQRLDVVAECRKPLPKRAVAEAIEGFEAALARLELGGRLSIRCGRENFRT